MSLKSALYYAALTCVIAIYILSRFWNIGGTCLWFDEIFSVHAAEHSVSGLIHFVGLDLIHPPLFYLILKPWIAVFGDHPIAVRTLPALLSVVAIFPFIKLSDELRLGRWTTLLGLFLLAINGTVIKYAQEVRMYSLLMCLSLFSLWLFFRYLRTASGIVGLLVVNILLVHSHYFGWLVIASEVVVAIAFYRDRAWRLVVASGITGISFLPWLLLVLSYRDAGEGVGQNIGWMTRPGIIEVWTLVANLIEPFYYQSDSTEPIANLLVIVPMLGLAITALGLYFAGQRTHDKGPGLIPLSLLLALPPAIVLIASLLLPYSFWGTRHLIVVFPIFSILLAALIGKTPRSFGIGLSAAVVAMAGIALLTMPARASAEYSWCVAGDALARSVRAGERPVVTEDLIAYHAWFSTRKVPGRITKLDGLSGAQEDKAFFLPRGFSEVSRRSLADLGDGEWTVLLRSHQWDEHAVPVEELRRAGYTIGDPMILDAANTKVVLFKVSR